jgi:hypothetical protein
MIYYYILLLLIIILVVLTIFYIFHIYNSLIYDDVDNHIYYMNKDETMMFLEYDEDKYVSNLSTVDLYARKVLSKEEYIYIIKNSATSFTNNDKDILNKCIERADELLRSVKIYNISKENNLSYTKNFNFNDLANIKWVLSLTSSENSDNNLIGGYEEGLPHTRKNVIFLSNKILNYPEDELIKILIHEKIHIYQRNNEELFKIIVENMGYTEVSNITEISYNTIKHIRSNPDVNRKIYKNQNTGKFMLCLYNSDKPNGINDVDLKDYSLEHPYEKIAYEISEYIHNMNKIEKYKNI